MEESVMDPTNSGNMLIKKEVVPVGTTIHQEQPFVYVLSSKFRSECCDFCFNKTQLSKCSNCKYVYYCTKRCQRQGWAIHKHECKHLKEVAPRVLPDAARLIFRILKRLENQGVSFKSYYTQKNYRTWKDLMSHYAELKEDSHRMDHIATLYEVLTEFLGGSDGLPNSAEFMGIYGRMCVNSFNICNQELQSLGTGIYLAASILDHSCQPNAVAIFEGTTLIIRTLEEFPVLDWSKVRISYIDTMASTSERQKDLLKTYYFLCDCPKCLGPENQREMFGAACENSNCDNSVIISDKGPSKCDKCEQNLTEEYINRFKSVTEFTDMHLDNMKNDIYLDVCKVCLNKQKGLLYKYNLKHVKILDLAFESSVTIEDFDGALAYGLELIECYNKYYPVIHPLTGLLHLKLCKLMIFKNRVKEGIMQLRKASDILKITHGPGSVLYKTEVLPLIQQCKHMINSNGLK